MSLQVVTVESVSGCEVVGVYLNDKLTKVGVSEYVENSELTFKKKLMKKDTTEVKRLLYVEDSKDETKKSIYTTSVPFTLPFTGKAKKVKDPNAPRKGLSAFMLFSNENRKSIQAKNPDAKFAEVGRLVGEAWKALGEKQKEVYNKRSSDDKSRYANDMVTYSKVSEVPTEVPTEVKVPKKKALKKVVETV